MPDAVPLPSSSTRLSPSNQSVVLCGHLHCLLLVVVLALRPLIWDVDVLAPAHLLYAGLVLVGPLLVIVELLMGLRQQVRWTWAAIPLLIVAALLVPGALRSHLVIEGWAQAGQTLLTVALGFWLMQVVPGRERLAWGALVTGFVGESILAVMQKITVMPQMLAQLNSGEMDSQGSGVSQGDLLNRITSGGLFGTFTVSNTLAVFLALIGVPLAVAWWRQRTWAVAGLLLLGMAALIGSGSKGGWLAIAIAVTVLAFNMAGDWLRDYLDPKLRRS